MQHLSLVGSPQINTKSKLRFFATICGMKNLASLAWVRLLSKPCEFKTNPSTFLAAVGT